MGEATFPYPSQQSKSNKSKLFIIIGAVIFVAVLIGGIFIMQQSKKIDEKKATVIEKKEPSPTEKPKIKKTSVKIQIVNGTGTPGQAGVVIKALEEAGYNPDNIKSSNAEKFDNLTTTITARVDFEEIVNDIKTVLKPTFDEITVSSSKLDENSEFDIVVVTGGEIYEEVTSTPSATISESPTPSPTITPTSTPNPT